MSNGNDIPTSSPRLLRGPARAIVRLIEEIGEVVSYWMEVVGDVVLFGLQILSWMFTRLPRKETLLPSFYQIGVLTLPVIALTGTFIGMVLAVQSYEQFRGMGLETQLGGVINLTLVRELGPVLAATMLAGRVGSAMAAELGTMRVTEQIDALESMGANPIYYLVVPRFLACLFMIPLLTIMADFMGIQGGYFYSVYVLDIDKFHYWYNSQRMVMNWDFFTGVAKSLLFGAAIALISCHRGFHCTPGAEGVGRAATDAFVYSFVLIIMLDLFMNIFLNATYAAIWQQAPKLF